MKKSKLLTKKILIPAGLIFVVLIGLSYAANRTIVADRLAEMAYREEYGSKGTSDGQFVISFTPGENNQKIASLGGFAGGFYDLPVAEVPHEYEGMPIVAVDEQAFSEFLNLQKVVLPQTIETIGSRAFAICPALKEVYLPASVVSISEDAFDESPNVTLYVEKGSYAEKFAAEHEMTYEFYTPEPLADVPEEEKLQAVYDQQYEEKLTYDIIYDYTGTPLCAVTVWNAMSDDKNLEIPNQIDGVDVRVIDAEAFGNYGNLDTIVMPETLESVGRVAFHNNGGLQKVYFHEGVSYIAYDAFEGASQVTICAPKNSYAHHYAVEHGMNFEEWYGG